VEPTKEEAEAERARGGVAWRSRSRGEGTWGGCGRVAPALVNLVLKSGFVGGCVKMSCLRIELT
jgi:hypothetical protein